MKEIFTRTRESDQMRSKICKVLQTLFHFISEYVHELMEEAVQLVQRGGKTLRQTIPILSNVPPPLAASLEHPELQVAVGRETSRFAHIK